VDERTNFIWLSHIGCLKVPDKKRCVLFRLSDERLRTKEFVILNEVKNLVIPGVDITDRDYYKIPRFARNDKLFFNCFDYNASNSQKLNSQSTGLSREVKRPGGIAIDS
jgi:hypothetical protein